MCSQTWTIYTHIYKKKKIFFSIQNQICYIEINIFYNIHLDKPINLLNFTGVLYQYIITCCNGVLVGMVALRLSNVFCEISDKENI